MSADSTCNICKEPSTLKCGSCRSVSYCGKDHQKTDWRNHKPNCVSYKPKQNALGSCPMNNSDGGSSKMQSEKEERVVSNKTFGRYLVATRTISEGEIIIKEAPIVAGPSQVTPPVCLGCHCLLSQFTARDCSICGWPVCSEICEKSSAHRPECEITSRHKNGKVKINTFDRNLPHPSYQCLTVLRCLYLKKAQPALWRKLTELESHCQERVSTFKYNADQKFIAQFIPKFFNFLDFSSEEILKVSGIIQVNAHEVPLREPEYIAIYEKASFLEHSCRANCMKSFTNSGEIVIRAGERISQGYHLSICYTDPLWGSEMRRNHLMETKFFRCECPRCLDPSELGTHFNSLKCLNRLCQGNLLPPFTKCEKCGREVGENLPEVSLELIFEEASRVDRESSKSCQEFLEKYKTVLHPHHNILVSFKLSLLDLYGWPGPLLSLPDQDLEWTIRTCRELNDLVKKLIPAENRLRGLLLYHLQFGLRERDRRRAMRSKVDRSKKALQERRGVLEEAYKYLSYEPDELPEGKMAIDVKKTLEEIDRILVTQSTGQYSIL